MNISHRVTAFFVLVILAANTTVHSEELEAGIASVDITPPIPYRMSGYFSERLSTGFKDRLKAKAIVFQQSDEVAALVFCDLIGISLDVSSRARKRASEATGIPVANIAIAATHSHTGPLYFGALRGHFHDRIVRKVGSDPHEIVDYPAKLIGKLVVAIKQAHESLQPVTLDAGYANESRLSFNRRFHMKDGSVRFNPGQLNTKIVRTAGPIDPQVGIIALKKTDGKKPFAAIIAFALHLDTVGGTEYSADYPRFLQYHMRKNTGPGFVSMFGAGTCGDINHVDVTIRGQRSAEEIGVMLGETVEKRLSDLSTVNKPSLAVRSASVEAPLQSFTDEEIAEARKNMELVDSSKLSFLERVRAYKITAVGMRSGKTLPIEVQAFRLSNDVAIVTLPGEVFVDLGIAIKADSPFKTTLVIALTNDAPGYIPTKKAFAEGSYETLNSRVKTGGGEMMVQTAIGLLRELAEKKVENR